MFETIKNCFKVKEIRKKIWITLLLLLIFRLGCYIPVPGITVSTFSDFITNGNYSFLEILSDITGGSLANATLFALGISPRQSGFQVQPYRHRDLRQCQDKNECHNFHGDA